MSTPKIERLSENVFNYQKFQADLYSAMQKAGDNIQDVSMKVLFRSAPFLQGVISNRTLPLEMAFALCQKYGLSMKNYEIMPRPPKTAANTSAPILQNGWDCVVKINADAGIAYMAIFNDGVKVADSRSRIRGKSDLEIVQAISYSAHMCYKLVEQIELSRKGSKA